MARTLLTVALSLSFVALTTAQQATPEAAEAEDVPAPPPPPVVRQAPPPAPATRVTGEKDAPKDMHVEAHRRLTELSTGGVKHYQRGAWLYGDYKHDTPCTDVVHCSKQCELDSGCYHWNYHVVHHRCQLKALSGGLDDDKSDWVTGHAARFKAMEGRTAVEL